MFLNNFSSIKIFKRNFRENCLKAFNDSPDNKNLMNLYDYIVRSRHDFIHYEIVNKLIGYWVEEQQISDVFHNYKGLGHDKTPDIIYELKGKIFIMDVSVVYSPIEDAVKMKKDKYDIVAMALAEFLKNQEVVFKPIIVSATGKNLMHVAVDLYNDFEIDFDQTSVESFLGECEDFIRRVHLLIDKDFYNNYMKKQYGINMTIGQIKDTKIDVSKMEKICQEKYPYDVKTNLKEEEVYNNIVSVHLENVKDGSFKDHKLRANDYENSFVNLKKKNESMNYKIGPTLPLLFSNEENMLHKVIGEFSEQKMIINFMNYFIDNYKGGDQFLNMFRVIFSKTTESLFNVPDSEFNFKVFNEGIGLIDDIYRKKYHDQRDEEIKREKTKSTSFRSYLHEIGVLKEDITKKTYVKREKTIKIDLNFKHTDYGEAWKSSGVNYYKTHDMEKSRVSERKTTPLEEHETIDNFIDYLTKNKKTSQYHEKTLDIKDFLNNKNVEIPDSERCNQLKREHINNYTEIVDEFLEMETSEFLWFYHLATSQLMHILSFNSTNDEITFFNCGNPNFLGIVTGGFKSLTENCSKAFLTCCYTRRPEMFTNIYGNLTKQNIGNGVWFVTTGWRRLSQDKCTFIRDSYYSVFSSTINLYFDMKVEDKDYWRQMAAIKSIISCCTVQQIQEFLMDNRYAMMSSFSTYTNIGTLLETKFKPPYKNSLSCWIINRLFKRLPLITKKVREGGISMNKPRFDQEKRVEETTGGEITIPSLWTNSICRNIEQILEEAFIYVHTMKEPSNMFHEKIKAINTINEFQEKYNNTPNLFKHGAISTKEDFHLFKKWVVTNEIGFSSNVIYHSFKNLIREINPNFQKIINDVLEESIGEIVSTKSVIHSLDREIEEIRNRKVKNSLIKRFVKRLSRVNNKDEEIDNVINEIKIYKRDNKSSIYTVKERQKVWETIIEIMERNHNINTVEDLCEDFILRNNADVEADICIKSQYGAKREFYVVNVGAKAMARIVEKFFQSLCQMCQSECISVPGDKKLLNMQRNLDDATRYCQKNKMKMRYVNGDCTKWSAAETMGSFLSMVEALKEFLPVGFYFLLRTCFSTWADKKINIPHDVYSKIIPIVDKTKYLMEIEESKKYIRSTHNFLQGMFNYASSLKASSCNYYTTKIWTKLHPSSRLKSFHLEHSDDYVQIIVYDTEEEFIEFRQLYKNMMRYHGYNDSARKTSCQELFMEFVSLMSFNGKMLYPKIKKTKEINTNLPCTGYKQDIEASLSRQGECMRMGCNMSFCYFFSKLHTYCVREAYSLLKNMRNFIENEYETPIEIFGTPDQLPIFSLFCKGNINNYRLFKYSKQGKNLLTQLYNYAHENDAIDDNFTVLDFENYTNYLHTPKFIYEKHSTVLTKMRKHFNINMETSRIFWDENISYKFIKPKNRDKLVEWLKIMFYNRGFTEAYVKMSRTRMTMRLSQFVGKKVVKINFVNEEEEKTLFDKVDVGKDLYTIRTYIKNLPYMLRNYSKHIDNYNLQKIVLRSDPTATAIYSMLENMKITRINTKIDMFKSTMATQTPNKIGWFYVENSPSLLIQRIFNKKNYDLDGRVPKSEISLQKDIDTIKSNFKISEKPNTFQVQSLYNDLSTSTYKPIIYMGFQRRKHTLLDAVIDQIKYNLSKYYTYDCESKGIDQIINPYNGIPYYIGSKSKPIINTSQCCLENLCLIYSYMKLTKNKTIIEILNFLDKITFEHMENNQKYFSNYKEILEIFNPTAVDISRHQIYIVKIAAYLRQALINKSDLMDNFVNSVYTYSYSFIKTALFFENKYQGRSICIYTYMNNNYKLYQDDNDIPRIYTNNKNITQNIMAFIIGLKLANIIPEDRLIENMIKPDLQKFFLKQKQQVDMPVKARMRVDLKNGWNYNDFDEIGNSLPIYLVKEEINKHNNMNVQSILKRNYPEINQNTLSVFLDGKKIFTLPFWMCKQTTTLFSKNQNDFEGIPLNDWFSNLLFQKILMKSTIYEKDVRNFKVTTDTSRKLLQSYRECKENGILALSRNDKIKQKEEERKIIENENKVIVEEMFGIDLDVFKIDTDMPELIPEGTVLEEFEFDDVPNESNYKDTMIVSGSINFDDFQLATRPSKEKKNINLEKQGNYYIRHCREPMDLCYLYHKTTNIKTKYYEYKATEILNFLMDIEKKNFSKMSIELETWYKSLYIYLQTDCYYRNGYYSSQDHYVYFDEIFKIYKQKIIPYDCEHLKKLKDKKIKILNYDERTISIGIKRLEFNEYQGGNDIINIENIIKNMKNWETLNQETRKEKISIDDILNEAETDND